MSEQDTARPMGPNSDYNPEAVITRLRGLLADANGMIANLRKDLAEAEESRDGWMSEHDKAVEQLADREQALERAREQLGETLKDECRALEQLADELHDHNTTKRLLSEQVDKRWKLQQALEAVANTECTNGRHFCKYCNAWVGEPHRDYCVVGPVLGLAIEAHSEASDD